MLELLGLMVRDLELLNVYLFIYLNPNNKKMKWLFNLENTMSSLLFLSLISALSNCFKTFLSLKTVAMNKHFWQFIYGRLTENVLTVIWFEEKYDFAPKINTLNSDFYLFIFFNLVSLLLHNNITASPASWVSTKTC